jgi:hypothetical protein
MVIYNSILKMTDVKNDIKVYDGVYNSLPALVRTEMKNMFSDVNGAKTSLAANIIDKKNDHVFYVKNDKVTTFIMVTKPKTMKFNSLKYEQLQNCNVLYNFVFDPKTSLVEYNKQCIDLMITAIIAKFPKLVFVLPVDPHTFKLMHPVMEYFGSKFNAGSIERSAFQEFTNLTIVKEITKFSPNLDNYDPIGNVLYL